MLGRGSFKQAGFSYLLVLSFVFVLLLSLTIASEQISTTAQREREAELLFIGQQYSNAIASYYRNSPNGLRQLPLNIEDLVQDKRSLLPLRHIRKLYRDPITESMDWGLVRDEQGQISGVYSLSNIQPLLTQENKSFSLDFNLAGVATVYSDWKFVYIPKNDDQAPAPQEQNNALDGL